ncbi:hypothetical protein BH10PSE12_BH10PSE12_24460 [soil metagenome]
MLRGPQGTLYGRNTIGGAINVITKGPTQEFTAQREGGISNFDGYELMGAVGGPIAGEKLIFRAAGWMAKRDGYVTNLSTGTKFQGVDNKGGRLRLAFVPTDALRIDLTAEFTHEGDKGAFGGFNQGTFGNPRAVFFKGGTAVPTTNTGNLREGYLSSDPILDRDTRAYIGKLDYDLGPASFTSITSYRELRVADSRDLEGSSLDVLEQLSYEKSNQFTQEFRLTSAPDGGLSFGGALDWIVGAFYYKDKSFLQDDFRVGVNSAVRAALGTATTDITTSDYKIESYAFFGQATLHVGEKIDLTLGGRYSHDKKRATQTGDTTDALPLVAADFSTTNGATYNSLDPRVVATYKFSRDANIYASYSTGFKSGGFQYVPFTRAQANVLFKPEDITAYEVGFKTEWLNRALRVNGAFFYYDYKNLQVSRIIDAGGAPVTLITNADACVSPFFASIRNDAGYGE